METPRTPARADDGDWSAEFQEARARAWRKARWAVVILVGSFAAVFWDIRFFLIGFLGAAGSILWLIFVCTRHYLCPACRKTPMFGSGRFGADGFSYSRRVDLDPEFCSNCGVRLKPEAVIKRLF
jgi:hypothetical protein